MINIEEILKKIGNTIKKNIVIISKNEKIVFPKDFHFEIQLSDIIQNVNKNYGGYNIYKINTNYNNFYACIESKEYKLDQTIELVLYMLEAAMNKRYSLSQYVKDILNGNYKDKNLIEIQDKYKVIVDNYLLLLEYPDLYKDEIHEIIIHSLDTSLVLNYKNHILILSNEENIDDICNDLAKNILSDLFVECSIIIGGKIKNIKDLSIIYENCLETIGLKKKFVLSDYVLNYEKMYMYRIVSSMKKELKNKILNNIFNSNTRQIMDQEMEGTIDAFFKNNLNLTDTAKKIFIHRNTLLYRIEKIHKYTGFDLRKFEDSWLFKLAWLIKGEHKIEKEDNL